ncbi:NADPH-dependent F420 reductase [Agrobacterium vitis]|uniref:NADPH-dependent F420 reductase n=1 Tax=Agrobacterium vitis TaxID=373 RepID=UPI000871CDA9|nr:NAD(P)-binding domain-containing protein [Agrobacterium vitis]MCE6077690.1 F420-dependent NADP oxidoreductase [Agrobacterium vitis]MCM2451250.1 NAD(P)-binding domain-containing protein [Agrobacterium vitis]MUO73073.1 F420-dependent NADP oxidoreductase [Agrobacterium vitis]MUO86274.1 F420-dependent NADP oxidoreductase [Agrobacterium vitis]MVA37159.1 F420-dependent NADP oxidoreductase [Agrobacterium vitis]
MTKTLGFLGAGRLAQMLAPKAIAGGWRVILSNSRGPETLADLVSQLGPNASAATSKDMVLAADIIILAIRWPQIADATAGLPWEGKTVIDATNNRLGPKPEDVIDIGGAIASKLVAGYLPGAKLVKAFNHEPIPVFDKTLPPAGDESVLFLAGADAEAKKQVAQLMRDLKATPIDLGAIDEGGLLIAMGGPLTNKFKLYTPSEAESETKAALI